VRRGLGRSIGALFVVSTVIVTGGAVAGAATAAVAAPGSLSAPSLSDGHGLTIDTEAQLDPRLLDVTVSTAALPEPADVRILLPSGYAADPSARYPVLYLFDGTSGHASDWTTMGDAEETTAGLPVIVVMPDITLDGDGGGWCTNWVNRGKYGEPEWDTFHIDELIPWIDQNFRTIASRDGRAIAGLSQGGFCSMSYAARYPDMFMTALSFSGAPDIAYDREAQLLAMGIINATEVGLDDVPPDSMFGNPVTDEINWAGHDPATLAANLRATNLFEFTGDGVPGPLDPHSLSSVPVEGAALETLVGLDNQLFHQRLEKLGIPSDWQDYGPGTHSWPYWARDLQESIGPVMYDFAHPLPAPASVTYTTVDDEYSEFGWQVGIDRRAEEFSTLSDADAGGFSLSGSGSAVVRTPPVFVPGASYLVTMRGDGVDLSTTASADRGGRLTLIVPLGPPNPYQEYTAAAIAAGTKSYTTVVGISPAPG
jgi:S-formylglutathione hydrolase FrmB